MQGTEETPSGTRPSEPICSVSGETIRLVDTDINVAHRSADAHRQPRHVLFRRGPSPSGCCSRGRPREPQGSNLTAQFARPARPLPGNLLHRVMSQAVDGSGTVGENVGPSSSGVGDQHLFGVDFHDSDAGSRCVRRKHCVHTRGSNALFLILAPFAAQCRHLRLHQLDGNTCLV